MAKMVEFDISLNKFITKLDIMDLESETNLKLITVENFESFLKKQIVNIYRKLNINSEIPNGFCACKLLMHGSTELGNRMKKSDIDVVLILPNHLSRNQWFNLIVERLRENQDTVQDIVAIIDTFVPVIKLKFEKIQFDMVISCLSKQFVPSKIDFHHEINNVPSIYEGVDPISVRGLSSIYILHIIKDMIKQHKLVFTKFIRTIKIWTFKREIDSYIFGFPSAIAWVIMALYIYKEMINQTSGKITVFDLIQQFFLTFTAWKWPKPVEIKTKNCESFTCERHLMPIISLVHPYKNTAFTVRKSSLDVIMNEFRRANDIIQNNENYNRKWDKLFQEIDISNEYRHFIHLKLVCAGDSFIRFQGLIASKLRDYASHLESLDKICLARIHSIGTPDKCEYDIEGKRSFSWVIGIKLEENVTFKISGVRREIDITEATLSFYHILNEKSPYNHFQKMLNIEYIKGKNIRRIIEKSRF